MRTIKLALLSAAVAMIGVGVLSVSSSTPADAKLHCKNVSKRWQVCGDGKPFTKFVVGVGFRFSKQSPNTLKSR